MVYRLRERGERLPRDVAEAGGVHGHLAVWRNVFDRSIGAELLACLKERTEGGVDVVPSLSQVRLLSVKGRGFMLYGSEHIRPLDKRSRDGVAVHRQLWRCVPLPHRAEGRHAGPA